MVPLPGRVSLPDVFFTPQPMTLHRRSRLLLLVFACFYSLCSLLQDVLACTLQCTAVYCSALHCSAGVVQAYCQWTAVDCRLHPPPSTHKDTRTCSLLRDLLACTNAHKSTRICSLLEHLLACTMYIKAPGFARFESICSLAQCT